jgi:ubiquinone/menaquinone biosynthesis C-methylase UbiE
MSRFWKILDNTLGGNVLDVACGNGQFIEILKDNLQSFTHITGLDVDVSVIKEAAGKFDGDQFTFVQGSSLKIPFPDSHFDTVSMSNGLHHLEDIRQGLKEMLRVLRKDGLMIISELYSDDLTESQKSHMYYHHMKAEVDHYLGIPHRYTFRKQEILGFVNELNLKNLAIHNCTENAEKQENAGDYIARMEVWKEQFRDSDLEREIQMRTEALKQRFKEAGLSRPPQLVLMGFKQESLTN